MMGKFRGSSQLPFRSLLLQIEFGLCGKTERDMGERERGGGLAEKEADEPACV